MDNIIDKKIKKYAAEQRIRIPSGYNERVMDAIVHSTDVSREPISLKLYRRAAVAVITLFVFIVGSMGAYATVNYVQKRVNAVSDEERQKLVNDVQNAKVSADSFSRELSESEKKRIRELAKDYEGKGRVPKSSVLEIHKTSEIDKNRVCFMPETSTFYLPERELTEEEMLEIIDFYCVRDFALNSQEKDDKMDMTGVKEITEKEAISKAVAAFDEILGIDVQNMTVQSDYQQQYDETTASSTDYVWFTNMETGEKYSATVNLQTGEVEGLECDNKDSEEVSNIKIESVDIDKIYEETSAIAQKMFDSKKTIESAYEIHYQDHSGRVYGGMITFHFVYQDGDACIVGYDVTENRICKVTCLSKEGCLAREQDMKVSADRLGLEVIKKRF